MKRLSLALLALVLFWAIPLVADITQPFTGSDGTPVTSFGFTTVEGSDMIIASNKVSTATPTGFELGSAIRNESAFPNDQFCEVLTRLVVATPHSRGGCTVRMVGSSYYECHAIEDGAGGVNVQINKVTTGSSSFLAQGPSSIAEGTNFTLRLTATSTALDCTVNTVSKASTTDATFTSGKPGIWQHNTGGPAALLDDFRSTDASVTTAKCGVIGGGVFCR